jgi:putative tricarboxylic transport membrane protein
LRRRTALALGLGMIAFAAGCGTRTPQLTKSISLVVAGGRGGVYAEVLRTLIEGGGLAPAARIRHEPARSLALARFAASAGPEEVMVVDPGLVALAAMDRSGPFFGRTVPLARLAGEWEVLVVPPWSVFRTFDDFAAALLRDPGGPAVAGGAEGGADHVLYGLTARGLGADTRPLRFVPYPDYAQAVAAMLDGRAAAGLGGHRDLAAYIRSGSLRPLAVSSAQRLDGLDAPTLIESGVRLEYANWTGLLGSAQLTEHDEAALIDLCHAIADLPAWRECCDERGWAPLFLAGDDFRKWLANEVIRTKDILGDFGLL